MSNGKTICTVCNYIYDEALVPQSLKFEELPDEWKCPECGSDKVMFQPCSCVSLPAPEQSCVLHSGARNFRSTPAANADGGLNKTTPVGQLVAERPLRACILEQYKIDYCCGGKATLEEACLKKGVKVEEILEKLRAADQKNLQSNAPDWTTTSLKDLIDHIVTTYHQPLRQELSRIAQLAEKVARIHGDKHPEMVEVLNVYLRFKAQLELHMQKEEMVLFPGIVSMEATGSPQIFGCGGGIEHPIEVMTHEHDDAGEALCAMRKLTNDFEAPDDACSSFKVLLYSLEQIESEMHQHVHKENNILFPRALELRKTAAIAR